MRRTPIILLLTLALFGTKLVAQDAAAPAAAATPAPEASSDATQVQKQLEREKERRKAQEAEIRAKLAEAKMKLEELKAREKQLESEVPKLDKDLAAAKARMEEAYETLSTVSSAFSEAEAKAKEAYKEQILGEFQTVYDREYKQQLEKHESDMDFISRNKWNATDFSHLELVVSKDEPSKTIVFDGANESRVSGWFQTMSFDEGVKNWHQIPSSATFSPVVQRNNPFVTDVALHLGTDLLKCGSTNMLDCDVHIFLGKDFRKQEGDNGRYRLVGVSWPVDLGRPVCWQCGEAPVYHCTPKPEPQKATEDVPSIATTLKEWVFADEGMKKRKEDAGLAHKTAVHTYNRENQQKPRKVEAIERKIAELKDKQKDLQKTIDDYEMMLEEYKEDVPVVPPPAAAGSSTNSVQEGL